MTQRSLILVQYFQFYEQFKIHCHFQNLSVLLKLGDRHYAFWPFINNSRADCLAASRFCCCRVNAVIRLVNQAKWHTDLKCDYVCVCVCVCVCVHVIVCMYYLTYTISRILLPRPLINPAAHIPERNNNDKEKSPRV